MIRNHDEAQGLGRYRPSTIVPSGYCSHLFPQYLQVYPYLYPSVRDSTNHTGIVMTSPTPTMMMPITTASRNGKCRRLSLRYVWQRGHCGLCPRRNTGAVLVIVPFDVTPAFAAPVEDDVITLNRRIPNPANPRGTPTYNRYRPGRNGKSTSRKYNTMPASSSSTPKIVSRELRMFDPSLWRLNVATNRN